MAKRLNTRDVLQLLEDYDFGLSEEDNSGFEGEGVERTFLEQTPNLVMWKTLKLWRKMKTNGL